MKTKQWLQQTSPGVFRSPKTMQCLLSGLFYYALIRAVMESKGTKSRTVYVKKLSANWILVQQLKYYVFKHIYH